MGYKKQGFTNFGEPLTAEQLIKIEDAILEVEESIDSGYRLIGTTPMVAKQNYSSLKFSADEPTNYSITSPTVWSFETVSETPKTVKCTYTREEDRHVITSDNDPTGIAKWYSAYMDIVIDNLVVGQTYRINPQVSASFIIASDNGEINLCSYGVLNAKNENLVGTQDLAKSEGRAWRSFTPTETTAKLRVYPNAITDDTIVGTSGCFENFVVKRADTGDEIGEIIAITGNTSETPVVNNIPKDYLVTCDIETKIYGSSTVQSEIGNTTYTGPLTGKKIVVFGDSIMGMYRGVESVCWYIEQKSGAVVYNAGCGGCRMSTSHPSASFNAWSFPALVDSVTTHDFSYQENSTPGVNYFTGVTETLKSLNFNNIDIVIIHYGTNDYNLKAELDDENDKYNTKTCCGGLRYGVEKLLTTYPQLTIFVSLPAYRLVNDSDGDGKIPVEESTNVYGQTYEEYRNGIQKAAEFYNLKIIDSYRQLGVNYLNQAAYIGDGTHHNKYGRKRLGEFIASELF